MLDFQDLFGEFLQPNQILIGEKIPERHHSDWTYQDKLPPLAVLLPNSTEQVSRILSLCNQHRIALVTQGGITGLAGAATPREAEVALSMELITGVEKIDSIGMSMVVRAGTTLAQIHQALENTAHVYGVDYGGRDLAQIGGNLSTNAGGTQVIRYGMTQAQVLGLEAVLADGTVVDSLNGLLKNNAGYDLKQLFIGSEGTLGVITKVQLRIHPRPASRCTALFALESYENCLMLLNLCRGLFAETLTGFEVMWKPYYLAATRASGTDPFQTSDSDHLYALIEIRGQNQSTDWSRFEELFRQCQQEGIVNNGALAETDEDADRLWSIRFAVKKILNDSSAIAHFDIGIPTRDIQSFANAVTLALSEQHSESAAYIFGHVADGNIHVLVTAEDDQEMQDIERLVYPICNQFEGTITAEHGVGVQKKEALLAQLTTAEIELMRLLKRTLDPHNILNPGRVFDLN